MRPTAKACAPMASAALGDRGAEGDGDRRRRRGRRGGRRRRREPGEGEPNGEHAPRERDYTSEEFASDAPARQEPAEPEERYTATASMPDSMAAPASLHPASMRPMIPARR